MNLVETFPYDKTIATNDFRQKNKAMVVTQPISLPKTKKQGLMQRCSVPWLLMLSTRSTLLAPIFCPAFYRVLQAAQPELCNKDHRREAMNGRQVEVENPNVQPGEFFLVGVNLLEDGPGEDSHFCFLGALQEVV